MRCLTVGLLLAVAAAVLLSRLDWGFLAVLNWYRLRPETRLVVALGGLVLLIACVVYGGAYRPRPGKVYTQTISPEEFERSGKEFARQQLEKLRSAPDFQRKMAELQRAKSAFDEEEPSSEALSSEL
jgi:hypothetical protein